MKEERDFSDELQSSFLRTMRSEMVGRDEEMGILQRALQDSLKGEGGLILIEGEAGVGKTRMVSELMERARDAGLEVIVGNCIEGGTPFLPFINALSGFEEEPAGRPATGIKEAYIIHTDGRLIVNRTGEDISSVDDDVMISTLTAIRDFIGDAFRPSETGTLNEMLFGDYMMVLEQGTLIYVVAVVDPDKAADLHPRLRKVIADFERDYGHILRIWKGELSEELMASGRLLDDLIAGEEARTTQVQTGEKGRQFENITNLLTAHARRRPVLLFLDDLQWMDPSSLDLLHYLARVSVEEPIMIIGAYRPEDLMDRGTPGQPHDLVMALRKLNRERLYTPIRLRRLTDEETRSMVNSIFQANSFSYGLPRKIFDKSKGNPLFTEEILKELIESRVLYEKGGEWSNSEIEDIGLPTSIKDVVMRRIGRLDETSREILNVASVAGNDFSYEVVQRVLGWKESRTIEVLDDLVRAKVLSESLGEDRYAFDHEVLREVLYENLSRLNRRKTHERIAAAIMDLNEDDLDPVCFELARHFANTKDREQAVRFNSLAGQKAFDSGAAIEAVKFFEVALANLEPDIETSEEAQRRQPKLIYDLGRCRSILGERAQALSFFGKTIEEAVRTGDRSMEAWAMQKAADEYNFLNEWPEAMDNYQKALTLFTDLKDDMGMAEANQGIGLVFFRQGELEMAIEHLGLAIDIFKQQRRDAQVGAALVHLGNILRNKGASEEALTNYERGLRILEKVDDKYEIARAHNNLGTLFNETIHDEAKAIYHYTRCLDISREIGHSRAEAYSLTGLSSVYIERGDFKLAEEYLREARAIFKRLGEKYMLGGISDHFADLHHKKGDLEKAEEEYNRAIGIYEESNLRYDLAYSLFSLGRVYIDMKRMEEAEKVLTRALTIAEDIGAMHLVTDILEVMSNLQ